MKEKHPSLWEQPVQKGPEVGACLEASIGGGDEVREVFWSIWVGIGNAEPWGL